jgi:hypothetical protein
MKTKYGINTEEKKWNASESFDFDELGTKVVICFTRVALIFIILNFCFQFFGFLRRRGQVM